MSGRSAKHSAWEWETNITSASSRLRSNLEYKQTGLDPVLEGGDFQFQFQFYKKSTPPGSNSHLRLQDTKQK